MPRARRRRSAISRAPTSRPAPTSARRRSRCRRRISVEATDANGAIVTYAATATDDTDPAPVLTCTPGSGALFPPGQTVVTCTATDAVGNDVSGSFTVTVTQAVASGRMTGSGSRGRGRCQSITSSSRPSGLGLRKPVASILGDRSRAGTPWAAPCAFESTAITSVTFATGEKSVVVKGTGTWNGDSGHTFELRATDASRDSFSIVVKNAAGAVVGSVSGSLRGGNIQAKAGGE